MKKIVIIGATGNVGRYATEYFVNKAAGQYEIVAVGKRQTDFFSRWGIPYYSVDISKKSDFDRLPIEDIHAVICTAGVMPSKMEGYDPARYIETNVAGVLNVLEYCKRTNANRILFTQTIRDVGNQMSKCELHSDMARDFSFVGDHAVYVISKNAAVDLIEHYYQEYGIKRYIFRLPTIYSYSQEEYFCVNGVKRIKAYRKIMKDAMQGEPLEVWGDPTMAHDVVYVKDLAKLFWLACEDEKGDGGVYNVGTGKPISILEQIEGIRDVFCDENNKSEIVFCPEKPNARNYRINIDKTVRELGFTPDYDYMDYLRDFKKEMEQNRFAEL